MSKKHEDPGFLSRWSQRKRGIDAEEAAVGDAAAATPAGESEAEANEVEEAENRAAAEAVDLEALDYESDYEVFLKPGVPADLRGAALQRLWRSNPLLANLDRMNEYDEDFRTPTGAAAAVVKTAWKVGKGFVDDETEETKQAAVAEETDAETAAETDAETTGETTEETTAEAAVAKPESSVSTRLPEQQPETPQVSDSGSQGSARQADEQPVEDAEALAAPQDAPLDRPRVGLRARLDLDAFRTRDSRS
ncbi:MAG: DUF3306 domain-containing protein [Kiloniellales bacterium]